MDDREPIPAAPAIEARLLGLLAAMPRLQGSTVDADRPFSDLGIDSLEIIAMTYELEQWLRIAIDPAVIYDFPTPRTFVHHLVRRLADEPQAPATQSLVG